MIWNTFDIKKKKKSLMPRFILCHNSFWLSMLYILILIRLKFYDIFLLCSIQYYVIKIVGDMWQLCDFLHRHHQWCLTLQEVHITTTCSNKLHFFTLLSSIKIKLLYPPQRSCRGVYWFHHVRPSVCRQILCRTIT